eukprot:gene5755-6456_t
MDKFRTIPHAIAENKGKRFCECAHAQAETPTKNAFRHCFETIEDAKRRFTRQKQRLVVVRELKEKQALEANDDGFKDEGENDLFSEASSMSGFSAVSASSKGSRMTRLLDSQCLRPEECRFLLLIRVNVGGSAEREPTESH